MKTKFNKLSAFLMIFTLTLSFIPSTSFGRTTDPLTHSTTPKEVPAEVKVMFTRLEEIKKIDKSTLSSVEKKELRKEVRSIKKALRSSGNGVYLSVGAIIIIVLLLILLL